MAQTIKIKRSTSTATPTSLSAGELAYSGKSDSNKLFIGHPDGTTGVVAIGGQYYTGIIDGATNANTASKLVLRDGSGNFAAGTITAALTGNASTATALATARTIGGVSFDGSANINLPGVNAAGNQNTSGNAATATTLANARTIGGVSFDGSANIDLPGVNSAGNQNTSGNAATATTLANARTISGVSFDGSANITLDTGDIGESGNLYFTNARARSAISASGDISYNSSTGVISFTAGSAPVTSVNSATGAVTLDSDDIGEGSSNLYFTNERAQDTVAGMITGATHSNISVSYDDTAGTLAFTAAAQYADSNARGAISVTDSGGDGSLAYNSTSGVITYTGPSASEVRAHLSAGTGVTYSGGAFSIGQAVATTSNVQFNNVTVDGTLTSDDITSTNISVAGNATITGNLTVQGTTTTVDSNTVNIGDNIIVLNKDETGTPSQDGGIEIERGSSTNVSLFWDESAGYWAANDASTTSKLLTAGNFAASFTGTLDGGSF